MMARSPLAPVLRSIAKRAIAFNAPGVITRLTFTTTHCTIDKQSTNNIIRVDVFTPSLSSLQSSTYIASYWLPSVQDKGNSFHRHHHHHRNLFPRPSGLAGARRELLDFMVQGKINRGRHTDHLAGHHSIRTNQCPPPPYPNSVKALKATSSFGLGRRC